MKKVLNNIGKGTLAFLLVFLLGFGMLFLSNLLPTDKIALHVRESGSVINTETDYWVITQGDMSSGLDNFTDAIMLLTAGYTGDDSALDKTIHNYRTYKKDATKGESCMECGILTADQMKRSSYEWYWEGFQIILKPLLLFLNLTQIRNLNTFVALTYIVTISLLLYHRKKTIYILPYLLSLAFLNIGTVFVSLQYSTIFHLTSIGMIIMLLFINKKKFCSNIWMYFLIFGMCTSYFDFLTYPVMTIGFSLILFLALTEPKKILSALGGVIGYSSLWGIGYVGMWYSKWVLSSLITGTNQIEKGLSKIRERSASTLGDETFTWSQMMGNMKGYLLNGVTKYLIVIILLISVILIIITKGYKEKNKVITMILILAISSYPFLWYTFAANHSMQHSYFTFKSMSVFVFGISSFLLPQVNLERLKYLLKEK